MKTAFEEAIDASSDLCSSMNLDDPAAHISPYGKIDSKEEFEEMANDGWDIKIEVDAYDKKWAELVIGGEHVRIEMDEYGDWKPVRSLTLKSEEEAMRELVRKDLDKPVGEWSDQDKQSWRDLGWKLPRGGK